MEAELEHRIGEGARIMRGLLGLWRNRGMTTNVEIGMLERTAEPTVLYGLESWVLNERE